VRVRQLDLPELIELQRIAGVTLFIERCAGQPERVNHSGRVLGIVGKFHRGCKVLPGVIIKPRINASPPCRGVQVRQRRL